jgi:hypothetical protein
MEPEEGASSANVQGNWGGADNDAHCRGCRHAEHDAEHLGRRFQKVSKYQVRGLSKRTMGIEGARL